MRIPVLWLMCALLSFLPVRAYAAGGNTIKVSQAIDLSGPDGNIGRDYVAGITTYFDTVNSAGGVNGRKIVYVARDDRGVAAETAKLGAELIKETRPDYLLGPIGAEAVSAMLAAPAFAQSRHVLFAPLADSSSLPRSRVLFWRPSLERELIFLLTYFDGLGFKDIGIAMQESTQNAASLRFLKEEIRKRKMRLAGVARIGNSPAAIHEEARLLKGSGARLVITIADTFASAQFLRAFRAYDASTYVAGTSLINLTTLAELAGTRATEWTVFSQVVPNPASSGSLLQSEHLKMMKKFRDEPVSSMTLEGFAVAKTLVAAMRADPAGGASLQKMAASRVRIDLGGMALTSGDASHNLSRYVDLAIFNGGSLMFGL